MIKKDIKVIVPAKDCRYNVPGHPENPRRLEASYRHLLTLHPPDVFVEPVEALEEDILAVHKKGLFDEVKSEEALDPDTPGASGIFKSAMLSAGACIQAAELAISGARSFVLIRPPGHHATPDQGMGFCYFNSVAIASMSIYKRGLAKKVAVLDLDCHHGNGTEAFMKGKPQFRYVSLHQSPCFPGTGLSSFDNCVNFPLPPGTEGPQFLEALSRAIADLNRWKPDVIGLSMGFDTYVKDPLTQFGLQIEDYKAIGKALQDIEAPLFAFLEGGYHEDLPLMIGEFLAGWNE